MRAGPCVFCDGALANERLTQSPRFLAVVDRYPVSPGHALVVPRRHVVSLFDLTPDEVAEAYALLAEARALVDAAYRPDGYNVGINDGPAAGRTVHHLHIHLIPRYVGDAPDPRGGVRLILPGPSPDLWSAATPASAGAPEAPPRAPEGETAVTSEDTLSGTAALGGVRDSGANLSIVEDR